MSNPALKQSEERHIALTPQQRMLTTPSGSRLNTYRELTVGSAGWGTLCGFELFTLLFGNMAGLPGLAARAAILPFFLRHSAKRPVIGRGVTIRQPNRISLGRGVVIDDYASLDVRAKADAVAEVGIECEDHVLVGRGSIITTKGARLILRAGSNIGTQCRIACRSDLEIGESTLVAAYCYIGCGNHGFSDLSQPIVEQPLEIRGPVKIGRNCWIGTKATVVDGITIGDDAIIGAHSLVTENVPARAIVAGTPAKILRFRD